MGIADHDLWHPQPALGRQLTDQPVPQAMVAQLRIDFATALRKHETQIQACVDNCFAHHGMHVTSHHLNHQHHGVQEPPGAVPQDISSPKLFQCSFEPIMPHESPSYLAGLSPPRQQKENIHVIENDVGVEEAEHSVALDHWPGRTTIAVAFGRGLSSVAQDVNGSLWRQAVAKDIEKNQMKLEKKKKNQGANDFLGEVRRLQSRAGMSSMARFVGSREYEWASALTIVLNAVFIGAETHHTAMRRQDEVNRGFEPSTADPQWIVTLQVIFCIIFTIELVGRWSVKGFLGFFMKSDWQWNSFDLFVVFVSLIEVIMGFASEGNPLLANISLIRILRVVRIIKIAKVIRVLKFFRELRMMLYSIIGSFKSLGWATMVLGMVFYIFGICLCAGVLGYLTDREAWISDDTVGLRDSFGTVTAAMISLLMAISGGNDWAMYYKQLEMMPAQYPALFVVFVMFCFLAVLNVVTGVFVESAMLVNKMDREVISQEEMDSKKEFLHNMHKMFIEMDIDGSGCIGIQEFEKQLDDERVLAYFDALKLDASEAGKLFMLLDVDKTGLVDIEEFIVGCHKLQGEARSMDVAVMQYEVRAIRQSMSGFADFTEQAFNEVVLKVNSALIKLGVDPTRITTAAQYDRQQEAEIKKLHEADRGGVDRSAHSVPLDFFEQTEWTATVVEPISPRGAIT